MLPVTYQNTRRHIPEDHDTKLHSLKNFKSPVLDHPERQTHITYVFSAFVFNYTKLRKIEKNS
jgi:hypothetical protein